ncbi:synaptonemal complex protein 3 [Ictidomys tridecemlineatus]|uniref:Synaptonemal complex protein 3-like n=1 Tax=Ictidomys tridecemlineatus TaxID=43179 RepID=A0A287DB14_ICTTR|nr:synaptonemal complex protein 3-like [Ictidomys tridecemlineatus]XP_040142786.1 synaptonemal complex protein 3-like [Ictidomys tridecemlineatus]KAG3273159.1 synaptonemal complex protein 3-like [Ictidomys tridecemlineatus]
MAPTARKSLGRAAKAQVEPQDLSVYDFVCPATSSGLDDSGEDNSLTGRHEQAVGEDVQKMLQEVGADITQALLARRKRFEMNTDASLKIINENIEHIRKIQQEQRQNLHYKYSQQFLPLFQQWDIEVQKAEEQEEKLANMFQEQRKLFLQSRIIQREKVKEIKNLYEQLLKSIKDLEEYHESLVIGEQSKVKKEMAELQEKILREIQQQEVAVVEKSLHSLLY